MRETFKTFSAISDIFLHKRCCLSYYEKGLVPALHQNDKMTEESRSNFTNVRGCIFIYSLISYVSVRLYSTCYSNIIDLEVFCLIDGSVCIVY